jgi:starvation-inducible DNA-binding protein
MSQFRTKYHLPQEKAQELETAFNILLANHRVAYMNVHGFHWLVQGDLFFNIHKELEALYEFEIEQIDSVAERMLSLGLRPIHTYKEVLELTQIKEAQDISEVNEIGALVLANLYILRDASLTVRNLADVIHDVGSVNKLEDDIQELEKKIWMWTAFLGGEK